MATWVDDIFGKGATEKAAAGGALGGAIGGATLGSSAGPLGALAGGAGGAIGNAIAPYVFGDMDVHGSHTEEVPADGQFKPSTGNQYVDAAVNGVGAAVDWVKDLF